MIKVLIEKPFKAPSEKQFIYKCPCCGSVLQFSEDDIESTVYLQDIHEWVKCPVCSQDMTICGRLFHRPKIYKFFHKKLFHNIK